LFNVALEKVVTDAGINTRGNIFYKSVQILAFAYDIDIIGRTQKSMKETFLNLERAVKKMNLQSNQNEIKYAPVIKNECANGPVHKEIGSYKFETVCIFNYLGSEVNCKNDVSDEIKKRVLAADKCLHGLRKHLKSRLISRKTRIMMYKVPVRPMPSYASEARPLSGLDEIILSIFLKEILEI
jgi:sorting nexin-29